MEKANEHACEALERMHKEGIPPTPDNFEVWYIYYAGLDPELEQAINLLIQSNKRITEERCKDIHQRYISHVKTEEAVRRTGDMIYDTLREMVEPIQNAKTATQAYGVTLTAASEELASASSKQILEDLVRRVVSETGKMLEKNKRLESDLESSAKVMEELHHDLEKVRKEAFTDGLTGLANRKSFDEDIRKVIRECEEEGRTFTLALLDIDHFKSFNDNFGHQIGDQVLRLVARTLIEGVKGRDLPSRYGGEEFAIIFPETNLTASITVTNALRQAVATKDVINRNTGDKLGRITLSAGVAEYLPGESIDDIVRRADTALYTAKHNGRNQVSAAMPGKRLPERKS